MNSLLSKLNKFRNKEENKELLLHSLIALVIRIGGAGAAFLMNIVVARYLGAEESGYFFLAVTVATVVVTVGKVGADQTVLRFVSVHSSKEEWGKVKQLISLINKWTLIPVVCLTFLICIFAKPVSVFVFGKSALTWPLFWCAMSMPFFALYNIYSQALQGRKKVMLAVTGLKILTPVFLILLALMLHPHDSTITAVYYCIACVLNLLLSYYWWRNSIPSSGKKDYIDKDSLWKSCMSLWIVAVMQQLIIWGGQFIAGIFNNASELAQLAVARNTSVLITFILTAVNYVSAPRFATMYNEGRMNDLRKYAITTARLMTFIAFPLVLVLWIFPDTILKLFGQDFIGAAWSLRVLALGQFINVITGSVGYLLIMSGHERDLRNTTIISGVIAIVAALILNPIFGAIGSAISTAIAVASSNLLAVAKVKKKLGFNTMNMFGLR